MPGNKILFLKINTNDLEQKNNIRKQIAENYLAGVSFY